jgi:hypothetical protein
MTSSQRIMKIAVPLAMIMMVFSTGCKKKETSRIDGDWTLTLAFPGKQPASLYVTFAGNDSTGSVTNPHGVNLGNYLMAYPQISINVQVYYNDATGNLVYLFTGVLTDDTHMFGTVVGYFSAAPDLTLNGTWTGTR